MITWTEISGMLGAYSYHGGVAAFADAVVDARAPEGLRCVFDGASGCVFVARCAGPHVGEREAADAQARRLRRHMRPDDRAVIFSGVAGASLAARRDRWGWCYAPIDPEAPQSTPTQVLYGAAALAAVTLDGDDVFSPMPARGFVLRELGGGATATFVAHGTFRGRAVVAEPLRDGIPEGLAAIVDRYRALAPKSTNASLRASLRASILASRDPEALARVCVHDALHPGGAK